MACNHHSEFVTCPACDPHYLGRQIKRVNDERERDAKENIMQGLLLACEMGYKACEAGKSLHETQIILRQLQKEKVKP